VNVPTTILLARHGETDWNAQRRVQGHTDTALNGRGRGQARALAENLARERLDAVYASDLGRAVETARAVAGGRGLDVVELPELRERHFGTWEGMSDAEVLERFPDARDRPHWGDGESPAELSERVLGALRGIAEAYPDGQILVVTHGGPLRAVLRQCEVQSDGPIDNCHVVRIEVEAGGFRSVD